VTLTDWCVGKDKKEVADDETGDTDEVVWGMCAGVILVLRNRHGCDFDRRSVLQEGGSILKVGECVS
jgi:hypothetical protein